MEERPKILPLVWLFLALAAMAALHRLWPVAPYLAGGWRWAGLAPLLPGLAMTIMAARQFLRADTGLVPFDEARVLVTDGFFRYTRNPMYLGMVCVLAGVSMLLGTVGTLAPIPLFVWVIRQRFILPEEKFMERAFGQPYLDYRARVRRWL